MTSYILNVSCPDTIGIVAAITGFLADNGGFIVELQQFGDVTTGTFFMRLHYTSDHPTLSHENWVEKFQKIANRFKMHFSIQPLHYRMKVLIMVSRQGHCLNALLNKHAMGTLAIDIPAIVSNHEDMAQMAGFYKIPFHYLPVDNTRRKQQEATVMELIERYQTDLTVLARYMQILSPTFVQKYPGKIINIHHSFLPGFKGASPYHQAFNRGVKLIGATAHYVTEDLDEGPIVDQEVTRVTHADSPEDLISKGQDTEAITLSRAVKWHIEKRVFLNGQRTIVFN